MRRKHKYHRDESRELQAIQEHLMTTDNPTQQKLEPIQRAESWLSDYNAGRLTASDLYTRCLIKDLLKLIDSRAPVVAPQGDAQQVLTKAIIDAVDDAVIRVGASANCYNEPADANSGAEYIAARVRSVIVGACTRQAQRGATPSPASPPVLPEQKSDVCIKCGHLKLSPWRGYCKHETSPFGKRPVTYCGCVCEFPAATPAPVVERCSATCTDFPLYPCAEAHRCVQDAGHPFDPLHGNDVHKFETHQTTVGPRTATPSPSLAAREAAAFMRSLDSIEHFTRALLKQDPNQAATAISVIADAILANVAALRAHCSPVPGDESRDAWSKWFDRLGDKASADVVNATADLVTDERLAALVQAGVLPKTG